MAGIITALLAVGCTGGEVAPASSVVETTPPPTTVEPRPSDGELKIGVLLPKTGPAAAIGQPLIESLQAEATAINAVGGVLGRPVTLVVADEGASIAEATLALDSLLQAGEVDAVIGPLSSTTALGVIGRAVAAGVLTCSPSAAAIALDDYPANGLFVRTIPSDSVLADALVRRVQESGRSTTAVVYVDDPYGRAFERAVTTRAANNALAVLGSVGIAPTDEEIVDRITETIEGAEAVIVVADTDTSLRILTALDAATSDLARPGVFINDQIRLARGSQAITSLSTGFRDLLKGIAHKIVVDDPGEAATPFLGQAIDCLSMIALATTLAGTDDPVAIRDALPLTTTRGQTCRDFVSCKDVLDLGRQIDFDGRTEVISISDEMIQQRGRFEIFEFADDGTEISADVFDHTLR